MPDLLLLISALVASFGTVDVTVRDGLVEPVGSGIAFSNGATWCRNGVPRIEVSRKSPDYVQTIAHELIHAVDCADNGRFDGSLLPYACVTTPTHDCAHILVDEWLANPTEAIRLLKGA